MATICKHDEEWDEFVNSYEKKTCIRQIMKCDSWLVSLIYFGYLVFGVCFTLYQLWTLGTNFFQYPIASAFTEANENTTFPDITICDMYPMAHDYYNRIPFEYYKSKLSSFNPPKESIPLLYSYSTYLLSTNPWRKDVNAQLQFNNQTWNPFIFMCLYTHTLQGGTGSCDDVITLTWDPMYKCQTIKLTDKQGDNTIGGISLYIYLDNIAKERNYYDWTEPRQMFANGVSVFVHTPGAKPGIRSMDLIAPGTASIVKITQTNRVRLPKPYSDRGCTNQKYLTGSNTDIYTYDSCFSVCLQNIVLKNCGCLSPFYQYTDGQLESAEYIFCGNFSAYPI